MTVEVPGKQIKNPAATGESCGRVHQCAHPESGRVRLYPKRHTWSVPRRAREARSELALALVAALVAALLDRIGDLAQEVRGD